MLIVILLPVSFFSQTLAGINLGHKPHAISFELLVFGILKIPLVIIAVIFCDLGVMRVILSFFAANFFLNKNIPKNEIWDGIPAKLLKKLKSSLINTPHVLPIR